MTTENQAPEGGLDLRAAAKKLAEAGAPLATIAFNLKQWIGHTLTRSDCESLATSQEAWDKARTTFNDALRASLAAVQAPAEGDVLAWRYPIGGGRYAATTDEASARSASTDGTVEALTLAARANVQPKGTPAAVPMCSEQAVLHALTMARSETHQQGDAALWQAFGRAMWRQFNAMLPAVQAPAPAPRASCEYCDGTGDVHRADGEWLGECNRCPAAVLHAFKNFHRLLCERFGYVHDDKDWRRDQLSLIEFMAAKSPSPAVPAGWRDEVARLMMFAGTAMNLASQRDMRNNLQDIADQLAALLATQEQPTSAVQAPAVPHGGVTVADILAEFDRRAAPGTGFYEPEEPAQIIRAMVAAKGNVPVHSTGGANG